MPPTRGRTKKEPVLRCYHCSSRKLHVERGANTRVIHGVKKRVANVICDECGKEWLSYHSAALAAMKQADADAAIKVHVDTNVVQATREKDKAKGE